MTTFDGPEKKKPIENIVRKGENAFNHFPNDKF